MVAKPGFTWFLREWLFELDGLWCSSEWKRRHTCWYFACISFLMIPAGSVCTDMYPRKQHSAVLLNMCMSVESSFNSTHTLLCFMQPPHSHRDLIPMERRKNLFSFSLNTTHFSICSFLAWKPNFLTQTFFPSCWCTRIYSVQKKSGGGNLLKKVQAAAWGAAWDANGAAKHNKNNVAAHEEETILPIKSRRPKTFKLWWGRD